MNECPMRLGLSLPGTGPVSEIVDQARHAEQLGFDVVLLLDHLQTTAPLPPLVAIAAAVPNIRVSNLVLNTAFYRPGLLTRDLASVDSATGGRLEIGLGAGYVEAEFEAVGLPFPRPSERIRLLQQHVLEIRRCFSDPRYVPPALQNSPRIMIAGMGDKLLAMAAQHADIISVGGLGAEGFLTERMNYVKSQAGERLTDIELAFTFFQVSLDDHDDLSALYLVQPDADEADLRRAATLLDGSVDEAADRVRRYRDDIGISYFTFHKTEATSWDTLRKLVDAIR
ncbi:MAG TPA: TIGR03621 family F420-dependent LLM class oxidoreductase [Mycobacterium sp.]